MKIAPPPPRVRETQTAGTLTPPDAIRQAAEILVEHFRVVAGNAAAGDVTDVPSSSADSSSSKINIEEINFSPRTTNALINNDIKSVKDLLKLSDTELRELKGFGSKAYEEVKDKIVELGITDSKEVA